MRATGWITGCASAALLALSGCGTIDIVGAYQVPESPEIDDAPWPRLIDTPEPPAPGTFAPGLPDPEVGQDVQGDLQDAARAANERRDALAGPVIDERTRQRLERTR